MVTQNLIHQFRHRTKDSCVHKKGKNPGDLCDPLVDFERSEKEVIDVYSTNSDSVLNVGVHLDY